MPFAQFHKACRAIGCFVNLLETKRLQKRAQQYAHMGVVVDDEGLEMFEACHGVKAPQSGSPRMRGCRAHVTKGSA